LKTALEKNRVRDEGWRVRKDGTRFFAEIILTAVKDENGAIQGFAKITKDITERKQTEEKLQVYSRSLERSNQELEDFVFVASHDLQEPLRKIISFGGFLKKNLGAALDEKNTHYLERIIDASQRMQVLILDLLKLTRVVTKGQRFTPISLSGALAEALSDLEIRISETGAKVETDPLPEIQADPVQIRQLFQNLVGNALKFKKPEEAPRVTIRAQMVGGDFLHSQGQCRLTVSDNGIGFEDIYSEKIFKVFERLHGQKEFPGSGIGLSVCKKIVERHGGTITAQGNPGVGAVFTVTLPLQQDKEIAG
jgi:light-regulated signal transduction histidine kinase (bacteriophytochrome)